jgi:phage gpG-like protein
MKIITDNVAKVLASIQELAGKQVMVGIPASKAEREEGDTEPINNAQLGYIHEYGAPASNIPARPFLIPGVAHAQDSINNHLQKAVKAAMSGDDEKVDVELNATGLIAQAGARNEINNGNFEALSARTLVDRRKRGRTGSKPLIDTGQLRNAITYVIRKKR